MDNISQQADEIEALASIYEEEFTQEDEDCSFSIKITPTVTLFVRLHAQYPSESPPEYELWAPELSKDQKSKVHTEFAHIFEDNKGHPLLFQWIEKLKEIALTQLKNIKEVEKIPETAPANVDLTHLEKFAEIVVHGQTIEDRKSVFQGHACAVKSEEDVKNFLEYLMQNKKISQATHNIYAYRIMKNSSILQDCEDDGENNASKRLLHLLQILNLQGVMVVVSRWYGGIQLGPDRFKHITNAARQALVQGGFVR